MSNYSDSEILEARAKLWRMGNLQWKLSPTQKRMFDFWKESKGKTTVFNCGRRVGKSYFLTIIAIEQCLNKPKSVVKFLQPEKGQIQTNIMPIMDHILEDCPPDVRPAYKTAGGYYEFPNGSKIQLKGTDGGNHEKLRGDNSDLCIVDEAGFLKAPLGYIIRSILVPSTMRTFGKIILSSSTPADADHEFIRYMESSKMRGTFFDVTTKRCLEEHEQENNLLFTRAMYQSLVEEYPLGEGDEEFRRECLNEVITDGHRSVIPEFNEKLKEQVVVEWKRPAFCDRYVAMDIGFEDLTVVLFGFYDFDNDVTVIEDEIVINGPEMTTDILADKILRKEEELWYNKITNEMMPVYLRVADNNNPILLNDLRRLYGLNFLPTAKDNKLAQVNNLRIEVGSYKVYINPRCKTLIHHLTHAKWNKTRDKFTRSPDAGHYDACDALIYFVRNVQKERNPYPPGYRRSFIGKPGDLFVRPNYVSEEPDYKEQLANIFKVRK